MNDQRNLLLAIVLSALVLFGWGALSDRFFPTAKPPSTAIVQGKEVVLPKPGADPTADGPRATRSREAALADSPRLRIDTPALRGSLALRGAQIDDLVLKRHQETIGRNAPPIRLLSPAGARGGAYAGFDWVGAGVDTPGREALWTADSTVLTPARPVTLAWSNATGQRFTLRLAVDDAYMFTAQQRVENRGGGAVGVQPFSYVSRGAVSKDPDSWTIHTGPVSVLNGITNFGLDYDDVAPGAPVAAATRGGWLGFTDLYWLTAIVPDQRGSGDATFRRAAGGGFQADFAGANRIVPPGQAATVTTRLFAGAKEVRMLEGYEERLGIARFGSAIDWGWFEWFVRPLLAVLLWLVTLAGNFGFAIILLVALVRLVLFPLAQKQFQSMAAMRILQPKMKALQERHKDDRAKLQQETMKLYQAEKVNPLAGCLPILLQIPIFYALYKMLMVSVEMRHQPFVGWIKDLSAPDPLSPVNLFGVLPFTGPAFVMIGIVPILLGVSMYFQFKLNPQPTDETQKQVFAILPWVLMFVMAPFAVGLQIYWITSNILQIAQQRLLYARHPELKAAAAK